jgi:prepilin-type N-terminal cleavage/methylation domain-containing protein
MRRRRGFTLVEALVALALTGLVTAGVAFALRTSLDASDRIRERSDTHAEGRAALDQLAADLASAYLSGVNREQTLFRAEPSATVPPGEPFLTLTTLSYRGSRAASPDGEPRSDALHVEYALQPSPDEGTPGSILTRREKWLTESGPGVTETVCGRVAGLRLRFLDGDDFQEDWDAGPETDAKLQVYDGEEEPSRVSTRKLPKAVEVVLLLAPSGEAARDKPRVYRTLVPLRADGTVPFESEVVPPPDPNANPNNSGGGNGTAGSSGQGAGR